MGKSGVAVALAVLAVDASQTYLARLVAPGCAVVRILRVGQQVTTPAPKRRFPRSWPDCQVASSSRWVAVDNITRRSTDDLSRGSSREKNLSASEIQSRRPVWAMIMRAAC